MIRLTRDGAVEPVSQDTDPRREREQDKYCFYCSADQKQHWQPDSVDPHPAICYDRINKE